MRAALSAAESRPGGRDAPGFRVGAPVGAGGANRPADVAATKRALAQLDIIPENEANATMAPRTFNGAIELFQSEFNLKRDGKLTPGGETERTLARLVRSEIAARHRHQGNHLQLASTDESPGRVYEDLGGDPRELAVPHPFESGKRDEPKRRDPELLSLLRDWQIYKDLPGTDHPMAKDILESMSRARHMSEADWRRLEKRMEMLEAIDRNYTSLVGNLKNRLKSTKYEPYQFPRVLTDQELKYFIELATLARDISAEINGAGETAVAPARGARSIKVAPVPSARLSAVRRLGNRVNVPLALATFFSGVSANKYGRFVTMYQQETERRKK